MKIFDPAILNLPFFEERHRQLAGRLEQWVEQNEALPEQWDRADVKDKGRRISRYLGEQGWLELGIDDRGASRTGPDFRSLCLVREALYATDGAQKIVDDALQLFGAAGLVRNSIAEKLYRQIRLLRNAHF